MTTDELIDALEKAAGPSRELDAEIARADGWIMTLGGWIGQGKIRQIGPDDRDQYAVLPSFTSNVDAALTLVPAGRRLYLTVLETGRAKATCVDATPVFVAHPNAAIAVCIAALKARREA